MVNCTASDVRRIIGTDLTDADLTELITLADAEMAGRGFTTPTWSTALRKLVSMLLTASLCALRDPESRSIGDYSEKIMTAGDWRDYAEDKIAKVSGISGAGGIALISWNDPLPEET